MKKIFAKFQLVSVALLFALFSSCSEKDNGKSYTFFVSLEENLTLSHVYISSFVSSAELSYPDISTIKGYISGDVNVYNMTYRTKAGGADIEASGLVCLPAQEGTYPVICFMNGTNTVNAYCPTNYAINTLFQMVEIVASMGYVVVIPDYPGFGASSGIPHPYLVAEPTVSSTADMLRALREIAESDLTGITIRNEYYMMGYSQGGWAAMSMHKALEKDLSEEFNLAGSVCGAGPYDINYLFQNMINVAEYPMPVYICYIINAYSRYSQFTNPVTDILNLPYSSRLSSLYNGTLDFSAINNQLTTSISGLINSDFLSGYATQSKYETVRNAMTANSIAPYNTLKPLLLVHGDSDTQVSPQVTEYFYTKMIESGTSGQVIQKKLFPGLDHDEGVVPGMIEGIKFIKSLEK